MKKNEANSRLLKHIHQIQNLSLRAEGILQIDVAPAILKELEEIKRHAEAALYEQCNWRHII